MADVSGGNTAECSTCIAQRYPEEPFVEDRRNRRVDSLSPYPIAVFPEIPLAPEPQGRAEWADCPGARPYFRISVGNCQTRDKVSEWAESVSTVPFICEIVTFRGFGVLHFCLEYFRPGARNFQRRTPRVKNGVGEWVILPDNASRSKRPPALFVTIG